MAAVREAGYLFGELGNQLVEEKSVTSRNVGVIVEVGQQDLRRNPTRQSIFPVAVLLNQTVFSETGQFDVQSVPRSPRCVGEFSDGEDILSVVSGLGFEVLLPKNYPLSKNKMIMVVFESPDPSNKGAEVGDKSVLIR